MLHLFAGLLAAGPPPPTPPAHQSDLNQTVYVWSHNWAAVIGIIICVILLNMWLNQFNHRDDDEDSA